MRISDWSSDVCSSDLTAGEIATARGGLEGGESVLAQSLGPIWRDHAMRGARDRVFVDPRAGREDATHHIGGSAARGCDVQYVAHASQRAAIRRSEEHTSELQSLMRISYAVFCLQK